MNSPERVVEYSGARQNRVNLRTKRLIYDNSFRQEVIEVEAKSRPTVSRPVRLGVGLPSRTHDPIFLFCLTVAGFLMWSALSDERMDP
jgi:hypothetical protein